VPDPGDSWDHRAHNLAVLPLERFLTKWHSMGLRDEPRLELIARLAPPATAVPEGDGLGALLTIDSATADAVPLALGGGDGVARSSSAPALAPGSEIVDLLALSALAIYEGQAWTYGGPTALRSRAQLRRAYAKAGYADRNSSDWELSYPPPIVVY
jgi:hypothetical protein